MLHEYAEEFWLADGPMVRFLGFFDYPTRMAVARLRNGDLWIWSPISLTPELAEAVDALGPVRHLVEPDLTFHAELGDAPDPSWGEEIAHVIFRGSFALEEAVFFHRASATALVCDLIQRFDPASLSGWRGALMRVDGLVGPDGSTPRELRASFWKRAAGRAALRTALDWNPKHLVIAHGVLPQENGREALARGLRWLG
ncbi:MAG: DUF4336 domain-containing protein [Deltaproteobacteria bacterium]|nr:DUF4336 domain-containing protein [Deltaproteobacteria bacterium]